MLLVKALFLLGTATAVFASGNVDAIVSGVVMVGHDTSKIDSHGEEVFRDPRNHPSAVASILKYAADRADFHPRQKGVITDSKVYQNFMKDMYQFPGFEPLHRQQKQLDLQGDREQFKREVAKKYMSERVDGQMMGRALERLLPYEIYQDNQEWLLNYIVLNTQCERGGSSKCDIQVEICSTILKLCRDSNSDETKIKRQTAEMVINVFNVKKEYLQEHASSLAQRIRTLRARKALKELSSTGMLGDDDSGDDDGIELESWFEGFDYLPRAFPRWNVQF